MLSQSNGVADRWNRMGDGTWIITVCRRSILK